MSKGYFDGDMFGYKPGDKVNDDGEVIINGDSDEEMEMEEMNFEHIKDYIKDNLTIDINTDLDGDLAVTLKLEDEEISYSWVSSGVIVHNGSQE